MGYVLDSTSLEYHGRLWVVVQHSTPFNYLAAHIFGVPKGSKAGCTALYPHETFYSSRVRASKGP